MRRPHNAMIKSAHYEKMANLDWCVDQCILCLDLPARTAPGRILGSRQKRELLVDFARYRDLFRGDVGTCLEMALPA